MESNANHRSNKLILWVLLLIFRSDTSHPLASRELSFGQNQEPYNRQAGFLLTNEKPVLVT
jgi:hypothetical protein